MFEMIVKMSAVTFIYVALTFLLWKMFEERYKTVDPEAGGIKTHGDGRLPVGLRVIIGIIYGVMAIFSTHFGVDYGDMMLNVRDLGPMCAGMFFDPASGIIAGLIGGIERYIAGTYFGVGPFTRVACSISTCLAGFLAAFVRVVIFKGKKPSMAYAFFMGAAIEVFHMYVVFLTHRDDMDMALLVVKTCSVPMILFSAFGLALTASIIKVSVDEWRNPLHRLPRDEVPVSNRFQIWLFGVTVLVLVLNFNFNFAMQTNAAEQDARDDLEIASMDISNAFAKIRLQGNKGSSFTHHVGRTGSFCIVDENGQFLAGSQGTLSYNSDFLKMIRTNEQGKFFSANVAGEDSLCYISSYDNGFKVFTCLPESEVYEARDAEAYETMLADILLFTIIYVLISLLVQHIVVDNLVLVNKSLNKITDGDLNEQVHVFESTEFASLSNDINETVNVLKGYIEAAEKRIEQELLLAKTIQASVLPKNFDFNHDGFEIYATMNPAKQVGGDFYDFFFVESDMLAMVIADVSGKGIPASLFMMRAKASIRGLAETGRALDEVFEKVNNEMCTGNEANMFVTVWMGIMNLKSGTMKCINAGHEYPALMRRDGGYELLRDKHGLAFGAMEDMPYKEYEIQLEPGDCLYVYTDGVPEAINLKEEQYGTDRMIKALNENRNRPLEELLPAIRTDIDKFVGEAEQFDDITMLGFRYFGGKKK